jgi:hypothetical protein
MVLIYVTVLLCFFSYLFVWRLLAQALIWALFVEVAVVWVAIRVGNERSVRRSKRTRQVETRVAIGLWSAIGLAILAIVAYNLHWWPWR